jgi:hypothetical protein
VTGSLAVLLALAAAAWAVRAAALWLDRPIPGAALALFLLVAVLPYPRAFVSHATPLPLDHATLTRPWYFEGSGTPYNPYLNDIATQVLPWTEASRLAWKDGALPLRDRWNGCGTPLAANSVSAAFSPLTLLTLLFPLWRGFTLSIAMKLLLAAAGMWLWTREIGASARASGFAAVAFALSFTFVPPWILYPQSGVFCLWPWTLFLVERCRDASRRRRAIAALSAVFVLTVLGGHPESAAMGFLFTGLWLSARWLSGDLPDFPRLTTRIALAAAVALGLTAFLLLPSVLAIGASGRLAAAARPYWQPHLSLLPHAPRWAGILPAFFPHTLGNAVASPTIPGGTGTFCEMAMGYAGILCWMAALLVFRPGSGRPRREWALWGVGLCGFGVAVCLWPLAEIFAHLPLFRYVFPLRFNGWMALALPAIAALELDRYTKDARHGRGKSTAVVLSAAVLAACGAALYVFLFALRRAGGGLPFQNWQLGAVLTILGLAALLALATRRRPDVFVVGLALLCGAELLYQWRGLNHLYAPELLFPETPLLRFLHAQPGPFRVAGKGSVLFPSTNVFARLEDIRTHDAVERRDYMAFLDRTCGYPYADYFKILQNVDAPALDFLNVRYVLAEPGAPAPGARWRRVYSGADGTVFENSRVLPRAFAPAHVRWVPPPRPRPWPVLDAAAAFGPAFSEVAALEDWSAAAYVLADGAGEVENPPVAISGYAESTNAASFDARVAEGGRPALVVLSLVQDGGWSARDASGAPLATFLANGPFLALRLAPGEHRVALTYCPPGLRLGFGVSLATLGLLAAAAVFGRRRRRTA